MADDGAPDDDPFDDGVADDGAPDDDPFGGGGPEDEEGRAPICPSCGVTALPSEVVDGFVCENPDCPATGEPVG